MTGYLSALVLYGVRRFFCLFIGPSCREPFCGRAAREGGICIEHLGPATLNGVVRGPAA